MKHVAPPVKAVSNSPDKGKTNSKRVTLADKEAMLRLFKETGSIAEVARRTGWSYVTVWKFLHKEGPLQFNADPNAPQFVAEVNIPGPKAWKDLGPIERGYLTDFRAFREHFFNRQTPPFHQEIASTISSKEHEKMLVLTPPGHGKSQCFSVDFPIWEMIRARCAGESWSCLLISKTDKMAQAFLSQIKRELSQNIALQLAFGRFKPEYPDVWKRDALTVEGFPIRKEPTFITAGAGSQVYGWRVKLIIADDIVDTENSATPDKANVLLQWFADELVSRLDPPTDSSPGLPVLCAVGTRFSTFDLYGKLWRQRDDYDEPIWYPLIYKAHDEGRCTGEHCEVCKSTCKHDKAWPEGCVLWPERFSYRKLRVLRAGQSASARFEFIYNQVEVQDEGALVTPEAAEKSKNPKRAFWEFPTGSRVICTLDPSPTRWAVAQAWAYCPLQITRSGERLEDMFYLVAQYRRMGVREPDYIKLMKEWTLHLRSLGVDPIWVVEVNAAQRWLLQSTEYQMMKYEIGITVIPHTTGRNKLDPELGVGIIGPPFEFSKVDLPWGDNECRRQVAQLISELTSYPGETTDCVMAAWFFFHHVKRLKQPLNAQFNDIIDLPPYLLARRAIVDTRTQMRELVPVAS